jgi:hypothetical protein
MLILLLIGVGIQVFTPDADIIKQKRPVCTGRMRIAAKYNPLF